MIPLAALEAEREGERVRQVIGRSWREALGGCGLEKGTEQERLRSVSGLRFRTCYSPLRETRKRMDRRPDGSVPYFIGGLFNNGENSRLATA
jgi:hypothetical protein